VDKEKEREERISESRNRSLGCSIMGPKGAEAPMGGKKDGARPNREGRNTDIISNCQEIEIFREEADTGWALTVDDKSRRRTGEQLVRNQCMYINYARCGAAKALP
jgi:hypothetical protein